MRYFDWHKWNPVFCRTAKEMADAINSFGIKDKRVDYVHVIGFAESMDSWEYYRTARQLLAGVGVSYDDIDSGKYPVDTTLLPQEVEICEPVVFVFTDGTTFEVMPKNASGLLMSVNQIPVNVVDGTNYSNFNSSKFFRRLQGCSIQEIRLFKQTTSSYHYYSDTPDNRTNLTFQFWVKSADRSENYGFYFRQSYPGWYLFGVTLQNHFDLRGNKTASIPLSDFKSAANHVQQVVMVEGHDSGGYFWIMPVNISEEERFGVEEYRNEEISISDSDIYTFLHFFLNKYFDPSIPYETIRPDPCTSLDKFEWNLEYNLYTYATMEAMLQDIEECAELLVEQYDDPYLIGLKDHFKWTDFDPDDSKYHKTPTDEEAERIIRENIHLATDFYHRFIFRIRTMMEHSPDYDYISFMGP